jgi:hypothetical protein
MMNENRAAGKKEKSGDEDYDGNAAVLRIRDVHPRTRIRIFSIPDPGPKIPGSGSAFASKNLSKF